MNGDHFSIEDLRRELKTLQVAMRNIQRLIEEAEEEEANRNRNADHWRDQATQGLRNRRQNRDYREKHPVVRDCSGAEILIGDEV